MGLFQPNLKIELCLNNFKCHPMIIETLVVPSLKYASPLVLKGETPMMQEYFLSFVWMMLDIRCVRLVGPIDEKYKAMDYTF